MNSEHPLQLEDAQKKLSLFRKHLDMLAQGVWESKHVSPEEVLEAVAELESLIQWATQQQELKVGSELLLEKLQQLHNIRQNLESPSIETERCYACVEDGKETTSDDDKTETDSIELPESEIVTVYNGVDEKQLEIDLLCLNSVLCETPNDIFERPNSTENNSEINVINIPEDLNVSLNVLECKEKTNTLSSVCPSSEELVNSTCSDVNRFTPLKNEIIILETNEDNKTSEVISDSKSSNDPLDVSMCAIKNLYDSLRSKKNELLKLSVMQSDQKHIEALQGVIIDFHKDITNLNSQLEQTKKENALLKEQVLELEEAENDARLAAQNFEQKLVFLQEKDSHSQAELYQLKQNLKKSAEVLAEKEAAEKEHRSQLKYMETLVQKYEDQIRSMEMKQKQESKIRLKHDKDKMIESRSCHEKGSQTYPQQKSYSKIHETTENKQNKETCSHLATNETEQSFSDSQVVRPESHVETIECKNQLIDETSSSCKNSYTENQAGGANPSQNELLKRLHKLMEDDAELQQQIHNVDQINLAMWMKLQSLENDIGKCKRQNVNEVESITRSEDCFSTATECHELSDQAIPQEELGSLDQNKQSIQERLMKLEEINTAFEKDLIIKDKLCDDKEKKSDEWRQTEETFRTELKRLASERDNLMQQVINLKKEKEELEQRVLQQQTELNVLKEKNQKEINKIRAEQETMTVQLHQRVKQLLSKEKDHLKMITSLKSERNSIQDKSELERLKCSYIELQLELSHSRDEIKKLENDFKIRLNECMEMHRVEETRLTSELDNLRKENTDCDRMINDLQLKQIELLDALKQQEKNLELARNTYEKNLKSTEGKHPVETEMKHQLNENEEDSLIETAALTEERLRAEKELQESMEDLRIKEESYKAKITELEINVKQLRQELNKIAQEEELIDKEENRLKQLDDQNVVLNPGGDLIQVSSEMNIISNNKSSSHLPVIPQPLPVKNTEEEVPSHKRNEVGAEIEMTVENVEQLRAQVRQLQSHLERISDSDFGEMSSTQTVSPINTFSMGIPKEDLDYAEIDECTGLAQRKQPNSGNVPSCLQKSSDERNSSGYKNCLQNENSSVDEAKEENDYDEVLPRPTNFHVVQQVGSDTLLVGWNYVNPSVLDGFEVYLNNEVHERIYIPDRTKALISGLDLKKPIRLSIYALSRYGQMSEPAVLELSPCQQNTKYFENEIEDIKNDLQNAMVEQQRPYSMEW